MTCGNWSERDYNTDQYLYAGAGFTVGGIPAGNKAIRLNGTKVDYGDKIITNTVYSYN